MSGESGDAALKAALETAVTELALGEGEPVFESDDDSVAARRRRRGAARPSALDRVALVRVDGVLRWTYQRAPRKIGNRRARRASAGLVAAEPIHSFEFQTVPPNQVIQALEALDSKLTPERGLRSWNGGALVKSKPLSSKSRALLFVHGTFSSGDTLFDALGATEEGKAFLADARRTYDQILTFDHPTLSVSPILNAFDLERDLAGSEGEVDVVCHSRGGLVTSWWLRTGARRIGSVVFVASPLEGTSLAAPARLKDALDGLANVAHAMTELSTTAGGFVPAVQPILGGAAGLMRIIGGTLSLGAKTPLLDAGLAVVPGLAAQSRVANNQELLRLCEGAWPSKPSCFAIKSNFEPNQPEAPWWKFWQRFREPITTAVDYGTDRIFDGPNDLVVDTSSMIRVTGAPLPASRVLDFGTTDRVHHLNYFAQPETVKFIRKSLRI